MTVSERIEGGTGRLLSTEAAATLGVGERLRLLLASVPTGILWLVVTLWSIPSIGLLVSSFRPVADIDDRGWWTVLTDPGFTTENYTEVLFESSAGRQSMAISLLNSLAIVIPATIVPIAIAAFAAYGFAWMSFRGRDWTFVALISMIALPNQMTFVPLLQLMNGGASFTVPATDLTLRLVPELGLANSAASVWLVHTAFGLPLAVFLLHNYISQLPRDVFDAARLDGATHFDIFWRLVLPLSRPAIAAFGIFQFLFTWNDFLIASIFLDNDKAPVTVALVNLVGAQGQNAHLRFPAAFITMAVPLVVFFALQKHFVRGITAGSVKG